ncbi:MAG: glycosyltransferase [Bdellovibrionales bacterium]
MSHLAPVRSPIDVVIATAHRHRLLRRCILSVMSAAKNVLGKTQLRFLISTSGDDPDTLLLIAQLRKDFPEFEFQHQHSEVPLSAAAARNRILPLCAAEWLYFIDDDAYIDEDFFIKFRESVAAFPAAAAIGGPNLTDDLSSPFQKASGAVLGSRFAAARSSARYTSKRKKRLACGEESLISCSLFVRARALEGLTFPEHLHTAEENWLMQDMIMRGHFFVYDADLFVWHERRASLGLFILQIYRYGLGRGQNMRHRPFTIRYYHILPSLSLILTTVCLAMSPWQPWLQQLWLGLLLSYALIGAAATLRLEFRDKAGVPLRLMSAFLFPLVHISYGLGVLRGLVAQIG